MTLEEARARASLLQHAMGEAIKDGVNQGFCVAKKLADVIKGAGLGNGGGNRAQSLSQRLQASSDAAANGEIVLERQQGAEQCGTFSAVRKQSAALRNGAAWRVFDVAHKVRRCICAPRLCARLQFCSTFRVPLANATDKASCIMRNHS